MKVEILPFGKKAFRVLKSYEVSKDAYGNDITGPFWMLIYTTFSKPVAWRVGDSVVTPNGRNALLFVPPFSWTSEICTIGTKVSVEGIFSAEPPPRSAPAFPCFLACKARFPAEPEELAAFFEKAKVVESVPMSPSPGPTAQRMKKLIDGNFREGIRIGELAMRMKSSSAFVSREFKKSFGFGPKYYERGIKITAATFFLMSGMAPAEAAHLAGYRDLGRFYKQFAKYMKMSPRKHQLRKNQKTPRMR